MDENEEKVEYAENSYAGIVIFLVIFAIIAITTTTIKANLYLEKNKVDEQIQPSASGENVKVEEPEDIGRTEVDQTYVLNLDEFYMTNNLKTEEKDFFSGEVIIPSQYDWAKKYEENINYIQIDGLKDEALEKKINEDLKNRAFAILNHENIEKYKIAEVETNVTANFSNILSVEIFSYLYNKQTYEEGSIRDRIYLNYNLTNGEQIKLEEIFAEGVSLKEILTEKLYREYSMYEDEWAYNDYIYEKTGKYYWDYDYETREEEIEKLGLKSQEEWVSWEYRSAIEEKVLKALMDLKNAELDFLLSEYSIILRATAEEYGNYIGIRGIHDKVTIYKKFMTEDSIFTDEYQLAHEEMCGWPISESQKIYYPTENMLLIETVYEDEYLKEDILKMEKEKIEADIQYAKATKGKFFVGKINVYGESCYYEKFEVDMQDYLKNKNAVLSLISRYEYEDFIEESKLETLGVDYLVYDYNYTDLDRYRFRYILESDSELLKNEEVNKLKLEELNLAYNEIFARHGHDFFTKDLRAHFGTMLWYKPIAGKTASLEELSEIEKQNLELIKNRIAELKSLGVTE